MEIKTNKELTEELVTIKKALMDFKEHDFANLENKLMENINRLLMRIGTFEERIKERLIFLIEKEEKNKI